MMKTKKSSKYNGRSHPRKKELFPAWHKRYQKFNGRNHFAAVCHKANSRVGIHNVSDTGDDNSDDGSEYEFLAGIDEEPAINAIKQISGYAKEIFTEMIINNKIVNLQIGHYNALRHRK